MDEMISVTIPVYNEEKNIDKLYQKLIIVLDEMDCDYEIIFINDGSSDAGPGIMNQLSQKDAKVKVIHFTRNFGQTAAMSAG